MCCGAAISREPMSGRSRQRLLDTGADERAGGRSLQEHGFEREAMSARVGGVCNPQWAREVMNTVTLGVGQWLLGGRGVQPTVGSGGNEQLVWDNGCLKVNIFNAYCIETFIAMRNLLPWCSLAVSSSEVCRETQVRQCVREGQRPAAGRTCVHARVAQSGAPLERRRECCSHICAHA